jgi:hypothetical protein
MFADGSTEFLKAIPQDILDDISLLNEEKQWMAAVTTKGFPVAFNSWAKADYDGFDGTGTVRSPRINPGACENRP